MLNKLRDVISGDLQTINDWIAVLKVASRLDFVSHRELAITRLVALASPVERIKLAKEYDIASWLGPAYKELCLRAQPLTVDEGSKLGLEDVVKISAVRDFVGKRAPMRTGQDGRAATLFEATFGERWTP